MILDSLEMVCAQVKEDLAVESNILFEGAWYNQDASATGGNFYAPAFTVAEFQGKILVEFLMTGTTYDQGGFATIGAFVNAMRGSTTYSQSFGNQYNDGFTRAKLQAAYGTAAAANETAVKGATADTTTYSNYAYGARKVVLGYNTPINKFWVSFSGFSFFSVAYCKITKIAD